MRLLAPAKINLHLRVAPPAPNGFHPLMSWFCTVGLYDTLDVEPAANGPLVFLRCDRADLLCDQSNLIVRAASTVGQLATPSPQPISVFLHKRIPIGGGLGGGSSDAARILLGVNQFWNLSLSTDRLSELAATFGSDVPFFLRGPSSVCTGRGEFVQPIARPRPRWVVLILPAMGISTPAAYRKFDELKLGRQQDIDLQPNWQEWTNLPADQLLPRLINDLEAPAFALEPRLGQLREQIEQTLARPVRMSGSGSTLFTLYDAQPAAEDASRQISARHHVNAVAVELAPQIADDLQN